MSDTGMVIGIVICIIILAIATDGGKRSIFTFNTSTTTVAEERVDTRNGYASGETETVLSGGSTARDTVISAPSETAAPPPHPPLTPREIEDRIAELYRKLDSLKEDVREATLRTPMSPYAGKVRLSQGNISSTDPDDEYLTLTAEWSNTSPLPISDWYVKSYVTGETAHVPKGDRVLASWRDPDEQPIMLMQGETAYLVSGESPVNTSFREHLCSGYLNEEETFTPYLSSRCPSPRDELADSTRIDLDDDDCYDFIERQTACVVPDEDTYSRGSIGGGCVRFIEETLNYKDCIRIHRYNPYFFRDGTWRVYLDSRDELWRAKREIIQLFDGDDRVIAVLEY